MRNRPPTATLKGSPGPPFANLIVMTPSAYVHVTSLVASLHSAACMAPDGSASVLPWHGGNEALPVCGSTVPVPSALSVSVPLTTEVLIVASMTGGPAWRPLMVVL